MSTVRRSSAAVLRATPKSPSRQAQRARAVEPRRQVAEGRVAQAQIGVDELRLAGRADVDLDERVREVVQLLRRRRRRRVGDQARARQHRPRRDPELARQRQHQRDAAAAAARQREAGRIGELVGRLDVSVTQSTTAAASARRSPGPPAPRCGAACSRTSGDDAQRVVELLAQVARPGAPAHAARRAHRRDVLDGRDRRALGEQLRHARRRKLVTRVPSTATRVCGLGAPARASSCSSTPGRRHQQELAARQRRVERLEEEALDQEAGRERLRRRRVSSVLPLDVVADRDVGRGDRLLAGDLLGLARRAVALVGAQASGSRRPPEPRSRPSVDGVLAVDAHDLVGQRHHRAAAGRPASPRDRAP